MEDTREAGALIETRFMSVRSFFDTTVIVCTDDDDSPEKQRVAQKICGTNIAAQGRAMQVLQEYFVTVTQKLGFNPREARRKVEILSEFDVATAGVGDILARH